MSYSRPDIASSSQQHAIDNHFIPAGGDVGYVDRHVEYEEELGSGCHSESECSGDTDDSDQDIEDHEDDDANLTSNDHLAHKAPLSDLEQLGRTKGGVIGDQHYPTSQDSIPRAREGAFVGYVGSREEHSKPPSRLHTYASKAKDHLRDENHRRKVLQGVQKGIVEVRDLMTQVQARDKVVAGAKGQGTTSNGKKLAKACVKIMVRIESRHCNLQMYDYDGDSSYNVALSIESNHEPCTCQLQP
jgi:hypothetical protein